MRSLHIIMLSQLELINPLCKENDKMDKFDEQKQEADRLACTGDYKRAAALYENLGYKTLAAHYEAQALIKKR